MKLELKRLTLENFKGIKQETLLFEKETWIYGANGKGKTSIFDAFVWCLFGKDHLGRSDYKLKPYDKDGKVIPRQDVLVEALIEVDGQPKTLKRIYQEEWVKPRTKEEEVLKGHTTKYFLDDITVKKSEYDAYVRSICDEIVFRSITYPAYFPSLSKDDQRAVLFSFINLTDEEVAGDNKDFKNLLEEVTGISFETFRKDIAARKSRIRQELSGLPDRIKGLEEGMPQMPDVEAISKQVEEKQAEIDTIDKALNDAATNMEKQNKERLTIQSEIHKLEQEQQNLQFEHQSKINADINKKKEAIRELESKKETADRKEKERLAKIEKLTGEKEEKNSLLESLREEWRRLNALTLEFPEGAFSCPTCERLLEVADIEEKQRQLTENFNKDKAKKIEENKAEGMSVSTRLKEIDLALQDISEPIQSELFTGSRSNVIENEIKVLEKNLDKYKITPKFIELEDKKNKKALQLKKTPPIADNTELIERKQLLVGEVDALKVKISHKQVVKNTQKRIGDHQAQIKTLNQELADLEKKEFTLKEFEFTKNTEYENRINEMFRFVKFRLFHTQVDGQVVPDFECMVDGVPYSTLNNAMQVAAGLDIIHTLSQKRGVYAPIWIDNRESITEIPDMDTQIINMVVDKTAKQLSFEYGSN